jgi:hypothetical protein
LPGGNIGSSGRPLCAHVRTRHLSPRWTLRRDVHGPRREAAQAVGRDHGRGRALKSSLATDVARGDYRELSEIRFDEWVRTYQGRTGRGIRATTLEEYRKDLENDAIPFFGRRRLAEIEPWDIRAFATRLSDRGLAPATVRVVIAPLRALFATAAEDS